MNNINKETNKIKELQEEIDHRAEVELQAEKLICKGEYEKAKELLDSLNDGLVKELAESVEDVMVAGEDETDRSNAERASCNNCINLIDAKSEILVLNEEKAILIKERDDAMLLIDLVLSAVKLWGQQNGLIDENGDPTREFISRHSKIGQFHNQSKEKEMAELKAGISTILNGLEKS